MTNTRDIDTIMAPCLECDHANDDVEHDFVRSCDLLRSGCPCNNNAPDEYRYVNEVLIAGNRPPGCPASRESRRT